MRNPRAGGCRVIAILWPCALASTTVHAQLQPPVFVETAYPLVSWAYDVDVGDLNADGIPDLHVTQSGTARVFLGAGAGSFAGPIDSALVQPWDIALADVTGDQRADRLRLDPGGWFYVDKSNGDGTFTQGGSYFSGFDPNEAHAADMNGDGLPDFVASFGDAFPGGITIWLSGGDGTFHDKFTLDATGLLEFVRPLDFADIDGDGHLDIVAADILGKLVVFRGNGAGQLLVPPLTLPSVGVFADFADVDADGRPDVVSSAGGTSPLQVFLNAGGGSFSGPILSSNGGNNWHVALADLNGDGLLDAATVATVAGMNQLRIALGHGDGSFEDPVPVPLSHEPNTVHAADLDGNGSADLVVVCSDTPAAVLVLLNRTPPFPWALQGTGLAGAAGLPTLHGQGTLAAGDGFSITLAHVAPGAFALLAVGDAPSGQPFKGGLLVPVPQIVFGLGTDASGGAIVVGLTPPGIPSHTSFYLQAWIADGSGPKGFTASNGLRAITP